MAPRRGRLYVIAGPSGVGKGSVVKELLSRDPEGLMLSVSVTTRDPRPEEVDGRDYRFVSNEGFDRLIEEGQLLEWAEIVGHRSGTPRVPVRAALEAGRDVICEIDVKGAFQVEEEEQSAVLIFLSPPSIDELESRLRGRGTETEEKIRTRLETAAWELTQTDRFDHVVVNEDVGQASSQVADIIQASR